MRIYQPDQLLWTQASKTRSIIAKPLCDLITDPSIVSKLLLSTLEGTQELGYSKSDTMVCVGVNDDFWQQDKNKLLAKYTIVNFTKDGWAVCMPKPDNIVDAVQIQKEWLQLSGQTDNKFEILAQWGTPCESGGFVQTGEGGDYICRNVNDHSDIWIVKQFIFRSTYRFLDNLQEGTDDVIPLKKVV